jgi:nucleoid-associated protein YgaU
MDVIADLARPYRRPQRRWDAERRMARAIVAALVVAVALLVLLGTVAYGGAGGGPERVTVAPGDTLWSIAVTHGHGGDVRDTVDAIVAANHLDGGLIHPGQVLVIPVG